MRARRWKNLALALAFGLLVGIGGASGQEARTGLWLRMEQRVRLDTISATALAVDPYGRVYLCDREANFVTLLDEDFRVVRYTGGFGWDKEHFDAPTDVCAANGLDVFVCDYNNHRVQRFDRQLNYIASLDGPRLEDPWRFTYPVSVAQSGQGDLFVLQREPPRVIRFDALGSPRLTFGGIESGEGQLVDPVKLELGDDGRVYVLDVGDESVKVFDFFGNFVGALGRGVLRRPRSLAWVSADLVVVTDAEAGLLALAGGEKPAPVAVVPEPPSAPVDLAAWGDEVYLLFGGEGSELWRARLTRSRRE